MFALTDDGTRGRLTVLWEDGLPECDPAGYVAGEIGIAVSTLRREFRKHDPDALRHYVATGELPPIK